MAVAGLHKASVLDPSRLGENYSPVSLRWVNKERPTTRTSSIRKMWRDLESERRFGENGRRQMSGLLTGNLESTDANEIENECPQSNNQIGFQNGQEDDNRSCLQQHSPLGVPEKERVRKIFHEWGSKSFGGHKQYTSRMNNSSRARLLGENECKRVRIVREWMELNAQQGDTSRTGLEDPATEIGSQIEQVRDGLVECEVAARRSYRRLYGRQALLDLLTKFKRERERELDNLLENQFVSNFSHRHRIQALLRGRFLLNQRFVQDEKQTSVAASELGLLRQTHSVSDMRKEFLSKLNDHNHAPEGARSDPSSDNDMEYDRVEQAEEIFQEIPDEIGQEFETTNLANDWEVHNPQEFASPGERHDNILQGDEKDQLPLTIEEKDQFDRNQGVYHTESSHGTLGTECRPRNPLQEVDEVMVDHYQSNVKEPEVHEVSTHVQTSRNGFSWQEISTQVEEWQESVTEDDYGRWDHLNHIESDESIDADSIENENENNHDHGWYRETAGSDFQESHEEWYDNVLEDATESWFGGNSYQEAAPVSRGDAFYASDDENRGMFELRELTSRRRVSSLLQSDFGTRLEQLMQSYVDRQEQAFESENEWMLDAEPQDQEQQSVDENTGGVEAVERPQTNRDNDFQGLADREFPDIHQHFGTEREIINGLRIDIDTLQQRMNDMQRMLEACMDMQLELQRSVQQEVYSALNRLSNSDAHKDGMRMHESEASLGRGVCVLCQDYRFDSLPDRCAHMYICSKCGEKVNWSKLKESVRHL